MCLCAVTQRAVVLRASRPRPCRLAEHLQWMKPCFCSPHLPLSSLALSLALCPFWRWNRSIVVLSSTAALCQADGAGLELGLWATLVTPGRLAAAEERPVLQLPVCSLCVYLTHSFFSPRSSRGGWWRRLPQHSDRRRVSAQQQRQQRKMWVQPLKDLFL